MHDVLIALTMLTMLLSPCLLALFTWPMRGEDKEFVVDLVKTR